MCDEGVEVVEGRVKGVERSVGGVGASEVLVVRVCLLAGETTVLTHVLLLSALFRSVLEENSVDLGAVRLERTQLGEVLVTLVAFVGLDLGVDAVVAFQVKGVVEAFKTRDAQEALEAEVNLEVPGELSLQLEGLATHGTLQRLAVCLRLRLPLLHTPPHHLVLQHGVLDALASVHELQSDAWLQTRSNEGGVQEGRVE